MLAPESPDRLRATGRPFLGVRFLNCRTYGRIYRNREGTAYAGFCPRCGASFQVPIGTQGTAQRFFLAVCPGS